MKTLYLIILTLIVASCIDIHQEPNIQGTWELISATTIKEDTVIEQDLSGKRMIKIINSDHFAFLNHDKHKGTKDSLAHFVAGGGTYTLNGRKYKESLEYCNFRQWEGNDFTFKVTLLKDTLIQEGQEEIKELNVNHKIIEKYVRVKNRRTANVYALPLM
ncbi:lipocalin-like domain-containing protein [Flammeovirga aprica]|uniref:Lipocalin-like domain-containing protein n=1 Tax=Flammeovirga aprica JL-4 TaxID=694437 RepID=A0A7X9RYT8_9BACT|nr:lipocalin-like domain-containing protein [Flammeovirga aprica]NME71297.1 lipocalin-like domain-containing protein [Flammeovirga aprica JL-4]